MKKIRRVVFVCDGGIGSSAMGAAVFRRTLARKGIRDVIAEAYAADLIPGEIDMVVCQKSFFKMLPQSLKDREIYQVESLVNADEYEELIECIQKRNG